MRFLNFVATALLVAAASAASTTTITVIQTAVAVEKVTSYIFTGTNDQVSTVVQTDTSFSILGATTTTGSEASTTPLTTTVTLEPPVETGSDLVIPPGLYLSSVSTTTTVVDGTPAVIEYLVLFTNTC